MSLTDSALDALMLEELRFVFKTRTGPREGVALNCDAHRFLACFIVCMCLFRGPQSSSGGRSPSRGKGAVVAVSSCPFSPGSDFNPGGFVSKRETSTVLQ